MKRSNTALSFSLLSVIILIFGCQKQGTTLNTENKINPNEKTELIINKEETSSMFIPIQAVVNDDKVRIRKSPSLSSDVVKLTYKDTLVLCINKTDTMQKIENMESYWYKIREQNTNTEGWIYGYFLDFTESQIKKHTTIVNAYLKIMKSVLINIDRLPEFMCSMWDEPKKIILYTGYDKQNNICLGFDSRFQITCLHVKNKDGQIVNVVYTYDGFNEMTNQSFSNTVEYEIVYDDFQRIIKIVPKEKKWELAEFVFEYENNTVTVYILGEYGREFGKYIFDFEKLEYECCNSEPPKIKKLIVVESGKAISEITGSEDNFNSQFKYSETIFKFDEFMRLENTIDANYDQPSNVLTVYQWGHVYKVIY